MKTFTEYDYVYNLAMQLKDEMPLLDVNTQNSYGQYRPDIIVNYKGSTLLIEVKMVKNYSSLPFSVAMQLENYKKHVPSIGIILIISSNINATLRMALDRLGISTLIAPGLEDIKNEIKRIFYRKADLEYPK